MRWCGGCPWQQPQQSNSHKHSQSRIILIQTWPLDSSASGNARESIELNVYPRRVLSNKLSSPHPFALLKGSPDWFAMTSRTSELTKTKMCGKITQVQNQGFNFSFLIDKSFFSSRKILCRILAVYVRMKQGQISWSCLGKKHCLTITC